MCRVTHQETALHATIRDWWDGTRATHVWLTLAWYDIVLRYRKSMLGPLWITLSMGILLLGMGPLYSLIFGVPLSQFFPYVTLGIVLWRFMSSTITEGCATVTAAGKFLKQSPYPLSLFTWQMIAKHVIHTAHDALIFIPVALIWGVTPSWHTLAFVPAFLLVVLMLQGMVVTIGILCARFSDFTQIVQSVMQMMMFITPVFWVPEGDVARSRMLTYNPLYYPLELMRRPLLGEPVPVQFWIWSGALCVAACATALALHAAKRRQLVYWM